jgi:hypothetical protein
MPTAQVNNTPSKPLGAQASDAIKRLGGDPDKYCVSKHHKPTAHLDTDTEGVSTVLPPVLGDHDIHTESPAWLQSLVSGEVDIEDLADELAQTIREDPRFLQKAWWQTFLDYLIALVPARLIAQSERLTYVRERLRQQEAKG